MGSYTKNCNATRCKTIYLTGKKRMTPVATKTSLPRSNSKTATIARLPQTQQNAQQANRRLKALLDFAIVIPTLMLIWPLFVILALAVKLDSPGPVIHRRRVLGRDGRIFDAFKFRTMYINGDEILAQHPKLKMELQQNYKLKCDPRVTRVGTFLRKFSLDELPQLFNVLAQDMSVIGPRIIAPDEITKYGQWGQTLLTVMPGLTGLWQVSGRSNTSYDERVNLDMQYIDNWSIFMDIKILLKTIPAVMKGDGAY
ncbi:MAG: sugar transferase [Anaerolineaceae bacterium]|nr:sugar transferase [Anaerolineaceae bacterium]